MSKTRSIAVTLTAATALIGGSAVSASAGTTAPAPKEQLAVVAEGSVMACFPWTHDEWYAHAEGDACRPGYTEGTITSKERGQCGFILVKWFNSSGGLLGSWRSQAACDLKSKDFVSAPAPRGSARVQVNMGRSTS